MLAARADWAPQAQGPIINKARKLYFLKASVVLTSVKSLPFYHLAKIRVNGSTNGSLTSAPKLRDLNSTQTQISLRSGHNHSLIGCDV